MRNNKCNCVKPSALSMGENRGGSGVKRRAKRSKERVLISGIMLGGLGSTMKSTTMIRGKVEGGGAFMGGTPLREGNRF